MAIAFVQAKSAGAYSGTTETAAFDANVTAGNLIAVYVLWRDAAVTATASDSLGNSYTAVANPTTLASPGARAGMFYAKNITGGACTVTITFSASAGSTMVIHEISGADTADPLNASAMGAQEDPGTGTDAVTSGTDTTSVAGCYIFGAIGTRGSVASSVGTNFTVRSQLSVSASVTSEDLIQASAGSIAATGTAGGMYDDCITGMMAFKPVAAGGSNMTGIYYRTLLQGGG